MLCLSPLCTKLRSFARDYDVVQSVAVILIYIQIACALIGSIGALYNGVLLINLAVALFALVAIESSSQKLGRTYAVLLACAILLDVAFFILFAADIWNISTEKYGGFVIFSVRVALTMEIIGCSVRLFSSLVWVQIYRLGASSMGSIYREPNFDLRTSILSSTNHPVVRTNSEAYEALGGAIYDPAYYSSLFEEPQDKGSHQGSPKVLTGDGGGSPSTNEAASRLKQFLGQVSNLAEITSDFSCSVLCMPNFTMLGQMTSYDSICPMDNVQPGMIHVCTCTCSVLLPLDFFCGGGN